MPSFALLPSRPPQRGLIWSTLLHLVAITALPFLVQLIPPPVLRAYPLPDMSLTYEPITYDALPAVSDSGSGHEGGSSGGSGPRAGGKAPGAGKPGAPAKAAAAAPAAAPPKMVYEGPQEIVSNSPNPTNTVQTIRRPDLPNAPKLKFAQKIQSMVVTAAPTVPMLSLPTPEPPKPEPVGAELAIVPPPVVADPVLPVRVPERRQKIANVEPPKLKTQVSSALPIPDVRNRTMPVLAEDENAKGTKTALVVNAVPVPPDATKAIPDAELSGSFAVMPLRKLAAADLTAGPVGPPSNGTAGSGGNTAGTGSGSGASGAGGTGAGGNDPHGTGKGGNGSGSGNGGSGSGTGTGTGAGSAATGNGAGNGTGRGSGSGSDVGSGHGSGRGGGSGSATGSGNGSGAGSGPGTGSGNGPGSGAGSGGGRFPGIVIVGGSSGRGGNLPSRAGLPPPRRSYDMTIISGGASSGASRDLGVFSRQDTVYTVYISMADAGGGPAFSMQYALAEGAQTGNGMLSPPFAMKKVAATATEEQIKSWGGPGPVFITGVVDESGRMRNLQAVNPHDPRSAAAVAPFSEWQFEPAHMSGKSVAAKVLIGVTLSASATGSTAR